MSDTVDFVITNENWDKNFDEVRMITDQLWLLLAFDTEKIDKVQLVSLYRNLRREACWLCNFESWHKVTQIR